MEPSGSIITQAAESKTLVYPEIEKEERQYMAADAYYEYHITVTQDIIYEEATDEEFLLAAIGSSAYRTWLSDEEDKGFADLID